MSDLVSLIAPYTPGIVLALSAFFGRTLLLVVVSWIAIYSTGRRSKRALAVLAFLTRRPPNPSGGQSPPE